MIYLGIRQTLQIAKETNFGVYLSSPEGSSAASTGTGSADPVPALARKAMKSADDSLFYLDETSILLPKAQVPEGAKQGDLVDVFVYKDSEDRAIATTEASVLTLAGLAELPVKAVTGIGAFLDWGLAKDLFLPYREQTRHLNAGDTVLVSLYIDKSQRLCATMRIYPYLSGGAPYQKGEWVDGMVYEVLPNFGAYVVIDKKYSALIPNKALQTHVSVGSTVHARVAVRHEDGRLELSLRDTIPQQLSSDGDMILAKLTSAGGFLPYHDKSDPEDIKTVFQLSKNAFKRAIGRLMKEGKITIEENGIRFK